MIQLKTKLFATSTEHDIETIRATNKKQREKIYEFSQAGGLSGRKFANDCLRLLHHFELKSNLAAMYFSQIVFYERLGLHLATNFIVEMDTGGFEVRTIKRKKTNKQTTAKKKN